MTHCSEMKYYSTHEDQLKEVRIYITDTVSKMKYLHLKIDELVRGYMDQADDRIVNGRGIH
jgi:hypothetical protein